MQLSRSNLSSGRLMHESKRNSCRLPNQIIFHCREMEVDMDLDGRYGQGGPFTNPALV
jgi:hypothetical protein